MMKNVLLKVGCGLALLYIMLYVSAIETAIDEPVFAIFAIVAAMYLGLFIKANLPIIERYPS